MSKRTIILTGGGSGGHITPLLAVAKELKKLQPSIRIVYVGHKGDKLLDIPSSDDSIDKVCTVRAGKFRRYHGESTMRQLLDVQTILLNTRDAFYLAIGFIQSIILLRKVKPEIIFIKGGFVGVPIGVAAGVLKVPYITHDSDAIPGLANRLISKKALKHAVAMPEKTYEYPLDKTITTGIPIREDYKRVTPSLQRQYRKHLNLPVKSRVLLIVGGGLGSQRINNAIIHIVPKLLQLHSCLRIIHIAGRDNLSEIEKRYNDSVPSREWDRLLVKGFVSDLFLYSGSADVVVTRAGATNLAEFSQQGRACIVVPSPFLTGGHQLKNANYLEDQKAVAVVDEKEMLKDESLLEAKINELISSEAERTALETEFSKFAKPQAGYKIARLLLDEAGIK